MKAYLQIDCPRCPTCGHVMWIEGDVIECITANCADTTQYRRPVVEIEPVTNEQSA